MKTINLHKAWLVMLVSIFATASYGQINVTATVNHMYCGDSDAGSASLSVSGGTSPYTYKWSTSATTSSVSSLAAGIYIATVYDNGGDSVVRSMAVGYRTVWDTLIKYELDSLDRITAVNTLGFYDNYTFGLNALSPNTDGWLEYYIAPGDTVQGSLGFAHNMNRDNSSEGNGFMLYGSYLMVHGNTISGTPLLGTYSAGAGCRLRMVFDGDSIRFIQMNVNGVLLAQAAFFYEGKGGSAGVVGLSSGSRVSAVYSSFDCSLLRLNFKALPVSNVHTYGNIETNIRGGSLPYLYQWSNGTSTRNLENVGVGNYTLTVTDGYGQTASSSAFLGAYVSWDPMVNVIENEYHNLISTEGAEPGGSFPDAYALALNGLQEDTFGTLLFEFNRASDFAGIVGFASTDTSTDENRGMGLIVLPADIEDFEEDGLYFVQPDSDVVYLGAIGDSVPLKIKMYKDNDTLVVVKNDVITMAFYFNFNNIALPMAVPYFTGAKIEKATCNFATYKPLAPVVPGGSRIICTSDSVHTIAMEGINSSGADKIVYAFNPSFSGGDTIGNNDTLLYPISINDTDTIWFKGLNSEMETAGATTEIILETRLQAALKPVLLSDTTLCAGSSFSAEIPLSQSGVVYELVFGDVVVDTASGTGDALVLGVVSMDTSAAVSVLALTANGCERLLRHSFVEVSQPVTSVTFTLGDTNVCQGMQYCYLAESEHGEFTYYSIISGSALIDSVTGCADSIAGNFSIQATSVSLFGCNALSDTLNISARLAPAGSILPEDTSVTPGAAVEISATGSGSVTWPALGASSESVTVTAVNGFIEYVANITDSTGCITKLKATVGIQQDSTSAGAMMSTMYFEKNDGQLLDSLTRYRTHSGSTEARFSQIGINFIKLRKTGTNVQDFGYFLNDSISPARFEGLRWGLQYLGASSSPTITHGPQLPGIINYNVGNDTTRWVNRVPKYAGIEYSDLYPGTDLRYYANATNNLEYDFVIHTDGEMDSIRIRYWGIDSLTLEDGELVIHTAWGEHRDSKPFSYQWDGIQKDTVDIGYVLLDSITFAFEANGVIDTARDIIIDPLTLQWGTWFTEPGLYGGPEAEISSMDANTSNIYLTGLIPFTNDIPAWWPPYGPFDPNVVPVYPTMFVASLNQAGNNVEYLTYFGGTNVMVEPQCVQYQAEQPAKVRCDNSGNVYVCGYTTSEGFYRSETGYGGLPINDNCPIGEYNRVGVNHFAFVVKFAPVSGIFTNSAAFGMNCPAQLPYPHTVLNGVMVFGGLTTAATSIDFSVKGVYVGGYTNAPEILHSAGAVPAINSREMDGFVIGLSTDLSTVQSGYPVFINGKKDDYVTDIVLTSHTLYVAGNTNSSDGNIFKLNSLAGHGQMKGDRDMFLQKYQTGQTTPQFSTYLGGDANDNCYSIDVDISKNVYVVGSTNSQDFDAVGTGLLTSNPAIHGTTYNYSGFATKIAGAGAVPSLLYSGYVGHSAHLTTCSGVRAYTNGSGAVVTSVEWYNHNQTPNLLPICSYDRTPDVYGEGNANTNLLLTILDNTGAVREETFWGTASLNNSILNKSSEPVHVDGASYMNLHQTDYSIYGQPTDHLLSVPTQAALKPTFPLPGSIIAAANPTTIPTTQGTVLQHNPDPNLPNDEFNILPGVIKFREGNVTVTAIASPATICGGAQSTLTASITGGNLADYNYEWTIPPSTTVINTSDAMIVSPSTTTTYRVSAISQGGCVMSADDVTVTVTSSPTSITVGSGDCDRKLTASNGGTYAWSTGQTSAVITAYTTGTYTVTVTNNGCTSTASAYVSTEACCPADVRFSGNYTSTDVCTHFGVTPNTAGVSILSLPSTTIFLDDDMVVNNNLLLFNCPNIIMGENARILVNPGATLNFINSHLYGCEFLWRGIEMSQNATPGEVGIFTSQIDDALYALWLKDGSRFRVNNSRFEDNFVGIYFNEALSGNPTPTVNQIAPMFGNQFVGINSLLPPSASMATAPPFQPGIGQADWAWAGIHAVKLNALNVGSPGQGINLFSNVANGIVVDAVTQTTVSNSVFLQNQTFGYSHTLTGLGVGLNLDMQGNGILATNFNRPRFSPNGSPLPCMLLVSGMGRNSATRTFLNCERGITTDRMNVLVMNSRFQSPPGVSRSGMRIQNSRGAAIFLDNNRVEHAERGIQILMNDPTATTWVRDNDIDISTNSTLLNGIGLEVRGSGLQNNARNDYSEIEIDMDDNVFAGAHINTVNSFRFYENPVHINSPATNRVGVIITNNDNFTDENNYVNGIITGSNVVNSFGDFPVGIYYGPNNDFGVHHCNTVEDVFTGIMMVGANTSLDFAGNKFNTLPIPGGVTARMNTGLLIDNSVTGANAQPNRGNEWFGANASYPFSSGDGTYLNFWVDNRTTGGVQLQFPTSQTGQGFPLRPLDVDVFPLGPTVFPPSPGTEHSCPDPPLCPTCLVFNGVDSATAYGDQEFDAYGDAIQWSSEEALFKKIMKDPTLIGRFPLADSFYNAKKAGNMAEFVRIDSIVQSNANPDSVTAAGWLSKLAYADSLIRVELVLDSILGDSTESDTVMYRNLYADIRTAIDSALLTVDSNMLTYYLRRDSAFAFALALNDSISTNNTVEDNRKAMNSIVLGYALGYDTAIIDTETLDMLYYIAFQCPLQGGKGVYMARSMLALTIDTVYIDDTLCTLGYMAKKEAEDVPRIIEEKIVKSVKMYPNPAGSYAFLEFSGLTTGYVRVVMTDLTGRKVFDDAVQATDGRYKINTLSFADGLYFVNLYDGEEKVFADKLNIIAK